MIPHRHVPARAAAFATALALAAHAAACDRPADRRAIVQGERAWGQAYVTGDVEAARRLLADDFRGVDPRGEFYDKSTVLNEVRAVPHGTFDAVGPIAVRFYGDTAVAQAHEHSIGPAPDRKAGWHVFTDTWVKRAGRWRIVAAEDLDQGAPPRAPIPAQACDPGGRQP